MDTKKIQARLERQCIRREYCSRDIFTKALRALSDAGLQPDEARETAAGIVKSLLADKFVDDKRYAAAFAREKSSLSGWGTVKIRYALSAKGICGEDADNAISEIDREKAGDKLHKILESKWKTLKGGDDPSAKLKLIKYALSRGFDYDEVRQEVENITR